MGTSPRPFPPRWRAPSFGAFRHLRTKSCIGLFFFFFGLPHFTGPIPLAAGSLIALAPRRSYTIFPWAVVFCAVTPSSLERRSRADWSTDRGTPPFFPYVPRGASPVSTCFLSLHTLSDTSHYFFKTTEPPESSCFMADPYSQATVVVFPNFSGILIVFFPKKGTTSI